MTVHVNGPVSVVTYKLSELNKTCMVAILKVLSIVMNEKQTKTKRNNVYSDKTTKMRQYSKNIFFSLNHYIHMIFILSFPPSLTSCILNPVDVKTILRSVSNVLALSIEQCDWKSRTGYEGKKFLRGNISS